MAGSWNHMTTRAGKLLGPRAFNGMIENGGDAYEAAEECFGMIWYLAESLARRAAAAGEFTPDGGRPSRTDILVFIEEARDAYRDGIETGGVQQ